MSFFSYHRCWYFSGTSRDQWTEHRRSLSVRFYLLKMARLWSGRWQNRTTTSVYRWKREFRRKMKFCSYIIFTTFFKGITVRKIYQSSVTDYQMKIEWLRKILIWHLLLCQVKKGETAENSRNCCFSLRKSIPNDPAVWKSACICRSMYQRLHCVLR